MRVKYYLYKLLVVFFWLVFWMVGSRIVDNTLLVPSPFSVYYTLRVLVVDKSFWLTIWNSIYRILSGFLLAFILGILIGYVSYYLKGIRLLLEPLVSGMKSVPVASFIILALIWLGPNHLAFLSAFIVTFPMLYVNTLEGLGKRDRELLEMAFVYHIPVIRKMAYIDWAALQPFVISGATSALGMSWKSGVAAEVIGVTKLSIGERLYMSKIYLDTAGLFAWTLVIIVISILFEGLVKIVLSSRRI